MSQESHVDLTQPDRPRVGKLAVPEKIEDSPRRGQDVGMPWDGLSNTRALTRRAMRIYRMLEPSLFALRKRHRLALLGIDDLADVPVATLDMAEDRPGCTGQCRRQIEIEREHLEKFLFAPLGKPGAFSRWRAVPHVLNLTRYPDFASYLTKIAHRGRGRGANGTRHIKKAQKLGYVSRPIGRGTYYPDMVEVKASKLFRTGGPALAAIPIVKKAMKASHQRDDWYGCPLHWAAVWGAFIRLRDASGAESEKLAAYCFVRRVGNRLHLVLIMGHSAHLRNGVVPFLFTDIMRWLLDRQDPHVVGIDYFQIGAIEDGKPTYLAWKRRFQFRPFIYAWAGG
jgi:hypothetical protein